MGAISSPLTPSLINKLSDDFPEIKFTESDITAWDPQARTVLYAPTCTPATLLHELGHGILRHNTYSRDIELVGLERDAWQKAQEISKHYRVKISESTISEQMDTYRDWLHARSTCPVCESTGLQDSKLHYHCPTCEHGWSVNQARTCGLKRTSDTKTPR